MSNCSGTQGAGKQGRRRPYSSLRDCAQGLRSRASYCWWFKYIKKCSITNLVSFQRVISFLYDRLYRPKNNIKPKKFGLLKKITGRILWAHENWDTVKPIIEKRRLEHGEHLLTAYQRVTKEMFLALGERRKLWATKASQLKAGTASIETKAR